MVQTRIRAGLIDFGNTTHRFYLDRFFDGWLSRKSGIDGHHFWQLFSNYPDGFVYKFEVGGEPDEMVADFRNRLKGIYEELSREFGRRVIPFEFTDEEFFEAWNSIFDLSSPDPNLMKFFRQLRGNGIKIFGFSNINKAHEKYLNGEGRKHRHTRFREYFISVNRFIASCDNDVRARKTFLTQASREECEKMFRRGLEIAKTTPEETFFVDDIPGYVEVFKQMGGHSIVFSGNWTRVKSELWNLGVRWE